MAEPAPDHHPDATQTESQTESKTDPEPGRKPEPAQPPRFELGSFAGLFVRGIGMGAADVVPGVSGGTIAFITGIYERFIAALGSLSPAFLIALVRKGPRASLAELKRVHWATLAPIGLGIVTAIILLSKIITGLMETRPGPTYALFFGLIAASAWTPLARIPRLRAQHWVAIALAAVFAFLLVGLTPSGGAVSTTRTSASAEHAFYLGKMRSAEQAASIRAEAGPDLTLALYDPEGVLDPALEDALLFADTEAFAEFSRAQPDAVLIEDRVPTLVYVFGCGVIAISAMILPGLSGSFLLLLLGVYASVFGALHRVVDHVFELVGRSPDILTSLSARPQWGDYALVGVFLVGVVVGLGTFSRVVSWLFRRAHDVTMAALTGLMIGALRLPYEVIVSDPAAGTGSSFWPLVIGVGLTGAAAVIGLHFVERRMNAARNPGH